MAAATMTTRHKVLVGGLGALTPVLMNLLIVDLNRLLINLTILVVGAYLIKVVVLFYLGGLVAYLHKDEHSPLKLFELGIAAPALITAFINAENVPVQQIPPSNTGTPTSSILFLTPADAQPAPAQDLKTFSLPQETATEQVMRGLTGSISKRVWVVIAGSHPKLEDATRQAQQISQKWPKYRGEVYSPYGNNPYYAVVIGANLTYEEAQALRRKAVQDGLPNDTYLWTFPRAGG